MQPPARVVHQPHQRLAAIHRGIAVAGQSSHVLPIRKVLEGRRVQIEDGGVEFDRRLRHEPVAFVDGVALHDAPLACAPLDTVEK
ncbi:MAG: hypothetical protein ACK559_38060, partial [bacterium]